MSETRNSYIHVPHTNDAEGILKVDHLAKEIAIYQKHYSRNSEFTIMVTKSVPFPGDKRNGLGQC